MSDNIFTSVKNNDINDVKEYINNGSDINITDDHGDTPLIYATRKGYIDIVQLLINNGADVNKCNIDGHTPLIYTAMDGHIEIAKVLVVNGADVNKAANEEDTPLIYAAIDGHIEIVKLLIHNGADVNTADDEGYTPLIYAARHGDIDITKLLIDNGADVNKAEEGGNTALLFAIRRNRIECVKLLLPLSNMKDMHYIKRIYANTANNSENGELIDKLMCNRDIDRYLTFCELFSIGTYAMSHDENKQEANSEMIGYDAPINEDEVRPFPRMFNSNSKDSSFDANLAGEIFMFARDSLKGELVINIE